MWTNVEDEKPADLRSVKLGVSLTIDDAKKLKTRLNTALGKSEALELDAGKLEIVDAAGLQLLVVLFSHCSPTVPVWKNVPDCLTDAARSLGVAEFLRLA